MKTAALYLRGKVVMGRSHLEAYAQLTDDEKNDYMVSGFYEPETGEFIADMCRDHFFNKKIVLIRHGQCEQQQDTDPALTAQGIEETVEVTRYLGQFDLTGFQGFTSPLLRCLQTAQIIQRNIDITFEVEHRLMETPCFLHENEKYQLHNRYEEFPEFTWPNEDGWELSYETETEFIKRVVEVLCKIPQKAILVSHFGVVTNMAKLALCDEKVTQANVPTASLTYIDNQEVKCFGCTV